MRTRCAAAILNAKANAPNEHQTYQAAHTDDLLPGMKRLLLEPFDGFKVSQVSTQRPQRNTR
jgi:hypothetical protein